jgi:hypothetical protein
VCPLQQVCRSLRVQPPTTKWCCSTPMPSIIQAYFNTNSSSSWMRPNNRPIRKVVQKTDNLQQTIIIKLWIQGEVRITLLIMESFQQTSSLIWCFLILVAKGSYLNTTRRQRSPLITFLWILNSNSWRLVTWVLSSHIKTLIKNSSSISVSHRRKGSTSKSKMSTPKHKLSWWMRQVS